MKIKEIKKYMNLCLEGEDTVEQRKNMFMNHRRCILQQIDDLKENLNLIDAKIAFYENHMGLLIQPVSTNLSLFSYQLSKLLFNTFTYDSLSTKYCCSCQFLAFQIIHNLIGKTSIYQYYRGIVVSRIDTSS